MTDDERPATKGDLLQMEERVKETMKLTVKPLIEDVAGHSKTLYGDDGRGGLTSDVGLLKWMTGGIVTVAGAIATLIASKWEKIRISFLGFH